MQPIERRRRSMDTFFRRHGILLGLVFLVIITTLLTGGTFFTQRNLINVTRQVAVNGILAVGMTLVILIGGIDLSVGSVVALTGVIVAQLQGLGTALAITLTLFVGLIIGSWNGFFVTKFRIPSFIITLGMMTIARGLALVFSGGQAIAPLNESFRVIGEDYILANVSLGIVFVIFFFIILSAIRQRKWGIANFVFVILGIVLLIWLISYKGMPICVVIFACIALLGIYVLRETKFGRYIYAIGGNEEAARLSGINVKFVKFLVFVIMGILASISGMVLAARLNAGVPTAGVMFELDAIASVVIGGTSLMGGYGTIGGSIIGALIIGTLNNGMQLLHIPSFYQEIAKGVIIIGAVLMDRRKK